MSCPIVRQLSSLLIVILLATSFSSQVFAVGYVQCVSGSPCSLGEFLYDDSYSPIATASCTLNTTDPAGSPLLTNQALTPHSDGWYDYSLDTLGLTPGLYPTEICCLVDSDQLCIDKSFTLNSENQINSDDVAAAVWNATASAYTTTGTFGTLYQTITALPQNIWSYTSRSLTSFGSLISNIWQHDNRSLTSNNLDSDTLATSGQITASHDDINSNLNSKTTSLLNSLNEIKSAMATLSGTPADNEILNRLLAQVLENRDLLDALVNEPIIKTFIDGGGETPDLNAKIEKTKVAISDSFALNQQVTSRLGLVTLKLDSLTVSALNTEIGAISQLINPGSNQTGLTTHLSWLEKAWGSQVTETASTHAGNTLAALKKAQSQLLGASTVEPARVNLMLALDHAHNLEVSIGDLSQTSTDSTLYGFLNKVQILAQTLDTNDQDIDSLLARWTKEPALNKSRIVSQLEKRVLSVNQLSNAPSILRHSGDTPDLSLKNQVLGLKAISGINRLLLARLAGEPFSSVWLEQGSVIFRVLIINPSERLTQKVPLKFALPHEVRLQDVIKHDPELSLRFDPTENSLMVEGEFTLAPSESRTYMIEVTDIFQISPDLINSLKNQAAELLKPLLKTPLYGQGATLKSDIDVALDKIIERQSSAETPDSQIRTFRENQIELAGVNQKLAQLKTLLADSSSANSMFNFIGGVQALALWVIVLVIIAGFVFLSIYLKHLRHQALAAAGYLNTATAPTPQETSDLSWPQELIRRYVERLDRLKIPTLDPSTRFYQIIVAILATTVLSAIVITSIIHNPITHPISPLSTGGRTTLTYP